MRGWLLGTVNGTTSGIIPANYVKLLGKNVVNNQNQTQNESTSTNSLPPRVMQKTNSVTTTNTPSYSMEQLFNES